MTNALPAGRYPSGSGPSGIRQAPKRATKIALVALVLLVGLGVAYYAYSKFSVKPIEGSQLSFDIVDEDTMSIRFSVTRQDPEQPAVCIVRARSRDGSETGRREVYIPPESASTTVEMTTEVTTSAAPAVGDVYGCTLDVPEYLRAR
ncbi:DUF4307 domain-containing protein [Rhodococcus sp. IEGM 1401]|jgi:hypothetical protein|uniref:DUF4307 domain-containing protein n=3 Tax=Rhodococcus TaxID=1827 RepID=A0ABU4AYK4_9NOCA|nr:MULTISPECIES: DUF4307 domain-containing protein [Rhodococcus]KAA0923221.1 DUF4307 domain-containing protein [Rhodococcus sp. ANT_H53B]KZF00553.1 hypothetical protein A2J02_08630 [Rhodococcus sp. EPR-147]MCZ4563989.1 DUF4307 domain-containing protein [Rhodococcus sp. IEGM 1401]MDI6630759.1 DUF4307 domain-containing protein [Rhodococcus sp. (in: high G+C Gram-positive bacteria)]MDI9924131.1 DUF4307 domain-containing protein [Rhodococcus sp. IEGM 1372]